MSITKDASNKANKYAVLMETSGEDHESWYYFLKFNGNEENLKHIQDQFNLIHDHVVLENIHLFDIDIMNLVSEATAKELTLLELNSRTYHRKFDGVLSKVDFNFLLSDNDDEKLWKIFDLIGDGDIKDFITLEDIPDGAFEYMDSDDDSNSSTSSTSSSSSEESDGESDLNKNKKILNDKIPSSLQAKYLERKK
jgi:hypothetical protein